MNALTTEKLINICPLGKLSNIEKYVQPLNEQMPIFDITTLLRIRHFISQLAHESAQFNYVEEIASGKAYDTGRLAARLGNTPEADGDGQKYKGRGLIQITGHDNYEQCSLALFGDMRLLDHPELLELPENAAKSAAWYWKEHNLNAYADKDDIMTITRKINGGYNGIDSRKAFYQRAKQQIV